MSWARDQGETCFFDAFVKQLMMMGIETECEAIYFLKRGNAYQSVRNSRKYIANPVISQLLTDLLIYEDVSRLPLN
jgi:hypothetical protein